MLSPNFLSQLKTDFETFGRLPAEDINELFVTSAVKQIEAYLNTELSEEDVVTDMRLAVINLSLFFYNNRDFQNRSKESAVWQFVSGLLSFYYPDNKFTDRDKDSSNSIESDQ